MYVSYYLFIWNKTYEAIGADSNTFSLLSSLLEPDTKSEKLFVVGAYRDNEVTPSHPLSVTLREVERRGGKFVDILLSPLNEAQVEQLLDDTFNSHTRSNPLLFFVAIYSY